MIQDLVGSRTPQKMDFVGYRTPQKMDFVGYRTPQKMDFVGYRTPQKIGTSTHRTGISFCGVLSENTNFQDNSVKMDTTWFKVSSVVFYICVLFYGSLVQRHCPLNFIEPGSMQLCDMCHIFLCNADAMQGYVCAVM